MTAGNEMTSQEAGPRHETAHGVVAAFVARHSVDLAAFNEWFDDCGFPQSDANVHDSRYLERLGQYVEERDGGANAAPQDIPEALKAGDVRITAASHPALHAAHDACTRSLGDAGGSEAYYAPCGAYDLDGIEKALAGLDGWGAEPVPEDSDFHRFAVCADGADRIAKRSAELDAAHRLLEEVQGQTESSRRVVEFHPDSSLERLSTASLADLPRPTLEALRTRIAREWLAGYDDPRRPNYDFADRLLAERGRHDGDCPHVAVPVAGTCAGCSTDEALAFADRALGRGSRPPELVPSDATNLPLILSALLADPSRAWSRPDLNRAHGEMSSLASTGRHDLLDSFLASLDTATLPTSVLGSLASGSVQYKNGLGSWEGLREAYWNRVAADARAPRRAITEQHATGENEQ